MKTIDLRDKRLNERLRTVLSQLASRPAASIPSACGGRAEMDAAYRLFANEKATFDRILAARRTATQQRLAAQPVVLLVQDTSEIDVTRPEQPVVGAGPLDGNSRRGALLHLLHAFTPDGTPLGTVGATAWVREEVAVCASLSREELKAIPIEEKESYRWVTTFQQAAEQARQCPGTQVICVADSEADIYELLVEAARQPRACDWIVRACHNRALLMEDGKDSSGKHLWEHIRAQAVLFRQTVHVRGRKPKVHCETRGRRQPRESRRTEVEVRAARVTLRPSWRADRKLPPVSVQVVLVSEPQPPAGDQPVEWLLVTSLPVD